MAVNFAQPDPNTCVPTSFAYLLYKLKGVDFKKTLNQLIPECYKNYDLEKNGMEFDQMKVVANKLHISCEFTTHKPLFNSYLAGVVRLPITQFVHTDLIDTAIREGALKLESGYFVYPYAHSVAVFENNDSTCTIFDPYLGSEREIKLEELNDNLEKPISYLYIK